MFVLGLPGPRAGEGLKPDTHCIRLGWPGVESCDVCEALRAAVQKERRACELICEQVRDSVVICVDPPAEVVILERIRDRGKAAILKQQP